MKNRAKCKKCNSVIESFHSTDYVECKCGAISVSGGDAMYCAAIDWADFVRVDDCDREIATRVEDKINGVKSQPSEKPNVNELLDRLDDIADGYDRLPAHARDGFATNDDLMSLIRVIAEILREIK